MTRRSHLVWILIIANLSLFLGIAVYCLARFNPPTIFSAFLATNNELASFTGIFGSAPSFFYTLALGLLIGALASNQTTARLHCLTWIALCLLLEISQLPIYSMWVTTWLSGALFESGWEFIESYWLRGTFDPIDLVATLSGGLISLGFVSNFRTGCIDANS